MNQQLVGNASALLLKQMDRAFQVDCVPEDDRGYYQVESTGAIPLILKCSISHFTEAVKEYCAGQGVLRFSFVKTDLNPAAQTWALQPFEGKESPFDTSDSRSAAAKLF